MHYVYLIQSVQHDFIYVGQTDDLKRRFAEHNAKKNIATKYYAPFNLVYYEAYISKKDALIRENMLKHKGSSIGHLKRRLANGFYTLKRA